MKRTKSIPGSIEFKAVLEGSKEQLRHLYRAASLEEAKAILDRILFEAEEASDAVLVPWGRTLKRRKNEILADHTWRAPNGNTEGVHRFCVLS